MTTLDKTFDPNGCDIDENVYAECPHCSSNSFSGIMKQAFTHVFESLPTLYKCKNCGNEEIY